MSKYERAHKKLQDERDVAIERSYLHGASVRDLAISWMVAEAFIERSLERSRRKREAETRKAEREFVKAFTPNKYGEYA
jgi:transposase